MNNWPRKGCSVTSEHKADAKHRIVGGASIVAKVVRDRIMKELQVGLGFEIGSGYPSDPNTIKALPELIRKEAIHPDVRWSWATVERFWEKHYSSPLPKRPPTGTTLFSL